MISASNYAVRSIIGEGSETLTIEIVKYIDQRLYERIDDLSELGRNSLLLGQLSKSNRDFERLPDIQEFIDAKNREWVSAPTGTPFGRYSQMPSPKLSGISRNITAKAMTCRTDMAGDY
ncbi:MAG: hypothetical protein HYS21_12060 [Deltaproteobacteria bacterium]|nr:hypothetical protein [Deltaproteobacteria bacterium]